MGKVEYDYDIILPKSTTNNLNNNLNKYNGTKSSPFTLNKNTMF